MLYGVDLAGDERYTIRVRDLTTGEQLPDEIPDTFAGASFSPDGRFIVYTTVDDAWRPDTVWLHELGTPVADDTKLFHEPDERYWVGAGFTRSDRFLVIGLGSSITSEEWLVDASDLRSAPRVIWPRVEGVEYEAEHAVVDGEDVLYILHNDDALDFELVQVAASDPSGPRTVIVAHKPGERLLGMSTFRDWAVLAYRRGGLARLALFDYASTGIDELDFDEALYAVGLGGNPEWAPPLLRIGYGSFVTPGTVYDYDFATGDLHLRKRQPVLGGYEPDDYAQARVWATAQDGTQIPMSLVWKQSFGEAGAAPRPVHLYGYGSYEHSIEPGFSVPRLSELDRGVVFAVAHVRGGGEMGRQWYEDGKLLAKRNTFTDFVDCAQHLVDRGITTPAQLVAEGGSAGGLLMGAVANLAPELFAGILADVPFVDALTTILDPSLPLTVIEWDEWGDPLHNADVYEYMKSYSPYENVPGCRVPQDPRRDLAQRHAGAVRRAGQVGRPPARGRRRCAPQVRDDRRAWGRLGPLQRVARARVRARLAAGRARRRRRLTPAPSCQRSATGDSLRAGRSGYVRLVSEVCLFSARMLAPPQRAADTDLHICPVLGVRRVTAREQWRDARITRELAASAPRRRPHPRRARGRLLTARDLPCDRVGRRGAGAPFVAPLARVRRGPAHRGGRQRTSHLSHRREVAGAVDA